MKSYKILFADLDGTLIKTASGKTFPEDCSDFRIRLDILDRIKRMEGLRFVFIVTNQGGIPEFVKKKDFEAKIFSISTFIQGYFNSESGVIMNDGDITVEFAFCDSIDKNCPNRKPNTGMLEHFVNGYLKYARSEYRDKSNMLMIGDASGKEGQFSDSDKKCAENFGIDYMDVEDFINS